MLLVENSLAMSNIWSEIRYNYLAPVGAALQSSNEDLASSVCRQIMKLCPARPSNPVVQDDDDFTRKYVS